MNKNGASVRKHQQDRRIGKTLTLLRESLHSLIREKPYDAIVVKEILDRANVGRSTFYAHFEDKDDLLASCIQEIILSVGSSGVPTSGEWYERILWFSLPVFEYHARRTPARHGVGGKGRAILHEHLRAAITELISDAVASEVRRGRQERWFATPELLIRYLASTFILVFDWWLDQKKALQPRNADELYRELVLPALTA